MQANCLVFPSPQSTSLINAAQNRIVLIPQTQRESYIYYHNYRRLESKSEYHYDYFQEVVERLSGTKDRKHDKRSKATEKQSSKTKKHFLKFQSEKEAQSFLQIPVSEKKAADFEQDLAKTRSRSQVTLETTAYQQTADTQVKAEQFIPCLFLAGLKSKLIVFFHANAEDICSSCQFLQLVNLETQCSVLAMEYRGYSVSKGETNPELINRDAERVIQYLTDQCRIPLKKIIIFGRSIGCAIALSVMKKRKFFSSVLLSPFLSLKKIAKDMYGDCASCALKEGFDNENNSLGIACPLLLIHGLKDNLVPYHHSIALFSKCQTYCRLKLIENMTHSKFNFRVDFVRHFIEFINDIQDNE